MERDPKTGTPYYRLNRLADAIRTPPDLDRRVCQRREKRIRHAEELRIDDATFAISQEALKRINNHPYLLDLVVEDFLVENLWVWYRYLEFFLKPKPSHLDSKHRPTDISSSLLLPRKDHLSGFESVEEMHEAAINYMVTRTYEDLRSEGFVVTEEDVMNAILRLRDTGQYSIERKVFYQIQVYDSLLEIHHDNMEYFDSMLRDTLKKIRRKRATVGRVRIAKRGTSEWLCYRLKYLTRRSAKRRNDRFRFLREVF